MSERVIGRNKQTYDWTMENHHHHVYPCSVQKHIAAKKVDWEFSYAVQRPIFASFLYGFRISLAYFSSAIISSSNIPVFTPLLHSWYNSFSVG